MMTIKRKHSASFKAEVAVALIREQEKIASICSRHGIHPTQARRWKDQALAGLESAFDNHAGQALQHKDEFIDELYKQIGQLKVELDWLKKKTDSIGLR